VAGIDKVTRNGLANFAGTDKSNFHFLALSTISFFCVFGACHSKNSSPFK
jgi:hypothetical protein